jgi:hypothetical protein
MSSSKIGFFAGFFFCLFAGQVAFAQFVSTSTDLSSTTSGSVKRIFTQNEKERLHLFVDQNFDRLQEAAARGSGAVLNDYVSLMGCQNSESLINKAIQKNYQRLFDSGKTELVDRTQHLIEGDAMLALACENRS